MLRANLARQRQAEGELLKPLPPRSNRRRNDYLIAALAGNLLAALGFIYLPGNPVTFVYLVAFVVIYNISLVWVLFFVMDRY
jgi:fatty acid desaturase